MYTGYSIDRSKFLSPDEVKKLLKTCEDLAIVDLAKGRTMWPTRHFFVHFALHTGLRVSEIANVRIGDLFLKGIQDRYLVVQNGKGGKKRTVYLDNKTVKMINQHIEYTRKVRYFSVEPDAPLISKKTNKPYTSTGLNLMFKRALEAANLPLSYSIHSCRHTYATNLLAKTGNLRFCQKQLGHANINMTALYADVLPEQNSALANKILE